MVTKKVTPAAKKVSPVTKLHGPAANLPKRGPGRPKGSRTFKSTRVAEMIMNGTSVPLEQYGTRLPHGTTPLEVMIEAMRKAYFRGGAEAAFPYAKDAAPYIHARIQNITLTNPAPSPDSPEAQPFKFLVEFVKPVIADDTDDK